MRCEKGWIGGVLESRPASGLARGKRQQGSAFQGLRRACSEGGLVGRGASTEPRDPGACWEGACCGGVGILLDRWRGLIKVSE